MCLTAKWGITIVMPTVCQTWRCPRCGNKRKAYASLRAEHGCLSLQWPGPLRLITVTYRMTGQADLVDAASALADFRRWLQLMRRRTRSQFRWFRVPEVTKKGQTHWHVISGDLIGPKLEAERLVRDCWAIASRRHGRVINHVVDVSETTSSRASSYVSKYLVKGQLNFAPLSERGFTRRWGTSRDWTHPASLELRGTAEDSWLRKEFIKPSGATGDPIRTDIKIGRRNAAISRLADRMGDPLVLALQKRDRKRAIASELVKLLRRSS